MVVVVGPELKKVPFCSPAEIVGQTCSPTLISYNKKKCDISMFFVVFFHIIIHIKLDLGVFKACLVTIGKFLTTFGHKKCMICGKFKVSSKTFPGHPKCSLAPPAVLAGFFNSESGVFNVSRG